MMDGRVKPGHDKNRISLSAAWPAASGAEAPAFS
jgi:hypothetical protein